MNTRILFGDATFNKDVFAARLREALDKARADMEQYEKETRPTYKRMQGRVNWIEPDRERQFTYSETATAWFVENMKAPRVDIIVDRFSLLPPGTFAVVDRTWRKKD